MRLESRLKENLISQNVAKTHSMLICSKKSKHRALISSNGKLDISVKYQTLKVVGITKYLGVQVDRNFEWKEHVLCPRAIGFLQYTKNFIQRNCLKNLN